tara:strand:+ start:702 stop:908 length:207 start_codon:yes stop_codon:yes gene_type:complete
VLAYQFSKIVTDKFGGILKYPADVTILSATYLFVELNEGWLEELLHVLGGVVRVLSVTQTHALKGLIW